VAYKSKVFSLVEPLHVKKNTTSVAPRNFGWLGGAPHFSAGGSATCFRLATAAEFGGREV